MRKCSAVMPDGPRAAPRLAERKLVANVSLKEVETTTRGCGSMRSSGMGLLGNGSLF